MPQPNSSMKNKSTKEHEQYWAFVEKTAHEVDLWPAWKRGEADPAHDRNAGNSCEVEHSIHKAASSARIG